ncbi:MAG: hypothetical protein ING22_11140 [Burkholderiales bacterium]|nr:hypothetical protein [Burkholderiales bacterium]
MTEATDFVVKNFEAIKHVGTRHVAGFVNALASALFAQAASDTSAKLRHNATILPCPERISFSTLMVCCILSRPRRIGCFAVYRAWRERWRNFQMLRSSSQVHGASSAQSTNWLRYWARHWVRE